MIPLAFGFGGPYDMLILAGVVVLLFGGTKLAGIGKSAGEAIKEFKKATHDNDPVTTTPTPTPVAAAPTTKTEENS